MEKIGVVGCWHQGVVGAACLADLGYDVLAADSDEARIDGLNSGTPPVFEPGLEELVRRGLDSGRLRFTADQAEAVRGRPFVFFMFDTPVDERDVADLSGIFSAAERVAPHLRDDVVVLVTAQVAVGACDRIKGIIREERPTLRFSIAYSPENLRLGRAIELFMHPALPVIGSDDVTALDRLEQVLTPLSGRWERVSLRTAEMTKHALNAFLATSVCFANELGNLCDEVGADGGRIAEVLRLEPRIGAKAMLFPGPGFSGGTLARDMQTLRALGDSVGVETPLLDGAWRSNQEQNGLIVRKVRNVLGSLAGRRICVLGLTYKPDTSTLRRSGSLAVVDALIAEGAVVRTHDPRADRAEVAAHGKTRFFEDPYEAMSGVEALIIMTPWLDYKNLDLAAVKRVMARPFVVDANNILNAERLEAAGFEFANVGRGRKACPRVSRTAGKKESSR